MANLMKTNPRKTDALKCLGDVDVSALATAVSKIPSAVWDEQNTLKPNKFDALDKTQHIVFRFVKSVLDHKDSYDLPLWDEWKDLVTPVMEQSTRPYCYKNAIYPRVMLAKMDPGGIIHPHIDAGPAAGFPHKIHVPLQTNPQVMFYVEPNFYHFEVGKAYEVNNRVTHAVKNEGDTSRIHLIFEYYDLDQAESF
jgi:hypothetical protein